MKRGPQRRTLGEKATEGKGGARQREASAEHDFALAKGEREWGKKGKITCVKHEKAFPLIDDPRRAFLGMVFTKKKGKTEGGDQGSKVIKITCRRKNVGGQKI